MSDTFQQKTAATSGPLASNYLWSNAANWTTGVVPVDGDSVVSHDIGYDDLASLSLTSVTQTAQQVAPGLYAPADLVVTGGSLDIGTVTQGPHTEVIAYGRGVGATTPVVVTVGDVVGTGLDGSAGEFGASGATSSLVDNAPTDPGAFYYAAYGGTVVLAASPNAASVFTYYLPGTFAFESLPTGSYAATFENLGQGDVLELPGTEVDSVSLDTGAGTLSITTDDGEYDFTNVQFSTTAPVTGYTAATDPATGLEAVTFLACYARGTRIATLAGERPVEDLVAGEMVLARFAGTAPVRWVGRRRLDCRRHPDPRAVWPVRITAGAFGDNLPTRDLYLSPDHAVFIDDVLIPIRLLVNGASIAQQAVDEITYFHIELDRHDVVLAEGMPAETYLDTDNRAAFENADVPTLLHPRFNERSPIDRAVGGCAPLAVDTRRVEPIWRRLAALGSETAHPPDATTDPELHLAFAGRRMKPVMAAEGRYIFVLPPGQDEVRVVSRAGTPADLRPWLDDRRRLGVSVTRIVVRGRQDVHEMAIDGPALMDGWHAPESNGTRIWRWTDGDAVLSLPPGVRIVEVHVCGSMDYPIDAWSDSVVERNPRKRQNTV